MNQHSDKNDQTLVEMTLLGDESAYEELVTRHQRAVMGTAFKVTNNSHSAEDASQDAFVSAWMNLSSLRDGAKFGSWVCAIAKNCARTLDAHYRSTVTDISLDLLQNLDLVDGEGNEWLAVRDDYADLHEAVEALNEKIRETIKLHYFEDKSVAEIASLLGIPVGTVKWRLSEGRKQLRKGYGIMEKTYDENESMVSRAMRQVEHLKLWKLKEDKDGFEDEYHAVLSAVEGLEESKGKSYMLADTLWMKMWWTDEENDAVFARIKKAAEDGHNDDVMQMVARHEANKMKGDERLDFMRNTQIPYYTKHGFPQTVAYTWFWLGYEYDNRGAHEAAIPCFEAAMAAVPPSDEYYAAAKAALAGELRTVATQKASTGVTCTHSANGEVFKQIGDKLYFWIQPGYGAWDLEAEGCVFWSLAICDSLLLDPTMRVGDRRVSDDGKITLTYTQSDEVCDTPAGRFAHCSVYVSEGSKYGVTYVKTWLCPGIGIVRQIITRDGRTFEWGLAEYRVDGGEGLLPFATGNRWRYALMSPDTNEKIERENIFEVTACENGSVTVSNTSFIQC